MRVILMLYLGEASRGVAASPFQPEDQIDQPTIAEHVQLLDRGVVDLQQR